MELSYTLLVALAVTMCIYNEDPEQLQFACTCGLAVGLILYLVTKEDSSQNSSISTEPFNLPSFPSTLNPSMDNLLVNLCPKTNFAYSLYPKPFMKGATEQLMCNDSGIPVNSEYMTNSRQICLDNTSKKILSSRGGNA